MIRPSKEEDLDSVVDIWLAASIAAHDFVDQAFWASKVALMREKYLPASECFVYERDGIVVGFYALLGDTLAAVFVTPAWQGAGIGSELVSHAKAQRTKLELTVYKSNLNSVEFYRKMGFTLVKEQLDEHTQHPELVMAWSV